MIIVEQDKTYFVNFNNVGQISLAISEDEKTEYGIMAQTIDKVEILLGRYSTEERAKEVLQEIITAITNWENLKVGQASGICLPIYKLPEE